MNMDLPLCKLCLKNEANQTGAHILTHSLISKCVNEATKKGRDSELMFSFGQDGATDLFVGRKVSLKKIKDVKGRDLTDEELGSNENAIVVDNYFCRSCEKLFGNVEAPFSASILKNIRDKQECNIVDNITLRLFFIIQAWRASVCSFDGFKLSTTFEEFLKGIVFEGCNQINDEFEKGLTEKILSIPIILNHLETKSGKESKNLVCIPRREEPYLLFLCDFVLQLYEPNSEKKLLDYYNLNENQSLDIINENEEIFKITLLNEVDSSNLITSILNSQFAPNALSGYLEKLSDGFKLQHIPPTIAETQRFLMLLVFTKDIPISERYSNGRIDKIISQLINER